MHRSSAEIVREYGPFPGVDNVGGVTYDGRNVWIAAGDKLSAFDPASGEVLRSIDVAAHAGTAFDGEHLFQISEDRILKIDPETGSVLATIPAPGAGGDSGLAWAEGALWVPHVYGEQRADGPPPCSLIDPPIDTASGARRRVHSVIHDLLADTGRGPRFRAPSWG